MATATKSKPTRKRSAKPKSKVTVTVAAFDYGIACNYRAIREAAPIDRFKPLQPGEYTPRGGTPLLDATARFIAQLEGLQKPGSVTIGALADESGSMSGQEASVIDGINEFVGGMADVEVDPEADGKVLAVILTDGMENASREVTHQQVADLIAEKEAAGWTFIYLGANQDAWAVGARLGTTRSANFTASAEGTRAALDWAGGEARSYLSSTDAYLQNASAARNTTIAEDGTDLGGVR